MVSKQDGTIRIATKKFVKKMPTCTGTPIMELKIYEKLAGTPKAITASIKKGDEGVAQAGPGEVCRDEPQRQKHLTNHTDQEESSGIRHKHLPRNLRGGQRDKRARARVEDAGDVD